MAMTITLNSAIWTQPLTVIGRLLEPLGIDQRVDEIDHDHDGHDRAEDIIDQHVRLTSSRRQAHTGSRRRRSRRHMRSSGNQTWRRSSNCRQLRATRADRQNIGDRCPADLRNPALDAAVIGSLSTRLMRPRPARDRVDARTGWRIKYPAAPLRFEADCHVVALTTHKDFSAIRPSALLFTPFDPRLGKPALIQIKAVKPELSEARRSRESAFAGTGRRRPALFRLYIAEREIRLESFLRNGIPQRR